MDTRLIDRPVERPSHAGLLGRRPERPAARPATSSASATSAPTLEVTWARHADEVRAAQRLRYQVFAEEMGAQLAPPAGTPAGLDVDPHDAHCEHLLVRTVASADAPAEVIGTYRVLTPAGARRAGGLYTETEFDLGRLGAIKPRLAELGRSCTAPAWRQGGVILMLWGSLFDFMHRNGLSHMIGCASISMRDGGHGAASLWRRLAEQHLAAPEQQVIPLTPLPVEHLDGTLDIDPPPLIKGYLRCGAQVLGAPAWDPGFGVADLPMLLDLARLPAAYRQRFLSTAHARKT